MKISLWLKGPFLTSLMLSWSGIKQCSELEMRVLSSSFLPVFARTPSFIKFSTGTYMNISMWLKSLFPICLMSSWSEQCKSTRNIIKFFILVFFQCLPGLSHLSSFLLFHSILFMELIWSFQYSWRVPFPLVWGLVDLVLNKTSEHESSLNFLLEFIWRFLCDCKMSFHNFDTSWSDDKCNQYSLEFSWIFLLFFTRTFRSSCLLFHSSFLLEIVEAFHVIYIKLVGKRLFTLSHQFHIYLI